MSNTKKTIYASLCTSIALISMGIVFYMDIYNSAQISVTGTIYGMHIEDAYTGKHHNNYETYYMIALKPDNPNYKCTSVSTTYETYARHKVGDRITFPSLHRNGIDRKFKAYSDWLVSGYLIISLISAGLAIGIKI